jgi:hypothetical protein
MFDIYLAIVLIVALSITFAALGYKLSRRHNPTAITLAVAAVLLLALHVWQWRDSLAPARLLPFSNLIILADPTVPLVAILIGVGAALVPGRPARRALLLTPLAALCLFAAYGWLGSRLTNLADHWSKGVCRQTTQASCTPAAAATILAHHGIKTNEQEMADLCLSTPEGSRAQGLYRGLKLKTADANLDVIPFHGTIEELKSAVARHGPVILTVQLKTGSRVDPRFHTEWGWVPGVHHHVVLFGFHQSGKLLEIGDPAVGREFWGIDALHALWHGQAIQLRAR